MTTKAPDPATVANPNPKKRAATTTAAPKPTPKFNGYTQLHKHCAKKEWEDAKRRCLSHPSELKIKDYDNYARTPLQVALVESCDVTLLKLFIDIHKTKNARNPGSKEAEMELVLQPDEDDCIPLHFAAYRGGPEVVRFLIARYPEALTCKNNDRQTPIDVAIENNRGEEIIDLFRIEIIKYLNKSD